VAEYLQLKGCLASTRGQRPKLPLVKDSIWHYLFEYFTERCRQLTFMKSTKREEGERGTQAGRTCQNRTNILPDSKGRGGCQW